MIGSLVSLALEGMRLNAIVIAALELKLPSYLECPTTISDLARIAGISERGCQAIADGMVALRLWRVTSGRYENTQIAGAALVQSSPEYVGDEQPALFSA